MPETELSKQVDDLLQQRLTALGLNPQAQPTAPMMITPGMQAPQPGATPTMLLLRIKIPTPGGEAGGFVAFALSANANPQTVQSIAQQACATWPIEVWQPRDRGWGNGGSSYGSGGGYNNRSNFGRRY